MTQSLIHDLLIILSAGLLAGLVCRRIGASVLIGYLVVGVFIGQGVLGWVSNEQHQLAHFAEAGVFLLLFSIGLEFSLDDLRRLGRNLFVGGAVQMGLVAVPVAFLMIALGRAWQPAVLISSAVAFSSTVLVFKALSEWGQSEQPHGLRAIGILLFQDAALVPLLLLVPLLTGSGATVGVADYLRLALISASFVVAIILLRHSLARWVIPVLARYRSPDLVILSTVVALSGVTLAAYWVGLPPAVGAFAAGLAFNGNRWTRQIDAMVLPFRETFAAIFFVSLGLILDPRLIWEQPILMSAMLVAVIAIKAAAAVIALRLTGMPIHQSLGMGIGLAHIGEFAFVLMLLGLESGVVSESDYQRLVSIAVGSLILTPPLMKLGLRRIRRDEVDEPLDDEQASEAEKNNGAVVIGAGPIGRQIASQLESSGKDVCLIDLSPINLHAFALEGFRTVAGDATRRVCLEHAGVPQAMLIAICVPEDESAVRIVKVIRKLNQSATLVVRCRFHANKIKLKESGADHVVSEETEAALALLKTIDSLQSGR